MRLERPNLRPDRPDFKSERPDLRPERLDGWVGQMNGRTNGQINGRTKVPLCFARPFGAAAQELVAPKRSMTNILD